MCCSYIHIHVCLVLEPEEDHQVQDEEEPPTSAKFATFVYGGALSAIWFFSCYNYLPALGHSSLCMYMHGSTPVSIYYKIYVPAILKIPKTELIHVDPVPGR